MHVCICVTPVSICRLKDRLGQPQAKDLWQRLQPTDLLIITVCVCACVCVCVCYPRLSGSSAGSVVQRQQQQSKADEWMNGGEDEDEEDEDGGSALSAAGFHRSVTCKLITLTSEQQYRLSPCSSP